MLNREVGCPTPKGGGKTKHNHAAYLSRVQDGQVTELWMVEALPAYSDEFWS